MDPSAQVLDPPIEVCLVLLPSQPINPGRRVSLETKECGPKHRTTEIVEERGEPLLSASPCDLSYARQRVGTRDLTSFAAQWLACALPCRRFAVILTGANARLGAEVVRYAFLVEDLHPLLPAGLPAHSD